VAEAKVFKNYEDASAFLKTLDMVVKRGHSLRRYFVRNEESQVS
jgi:hypothetical protein